VFPYEREAIRTKQNKTKQNKTKGEKAKRALPASIEPQSQDKARHSTTHKTRTAPKHKSN